MKRSSIARNVVKNLSESPLASFIKPPKLVTLEKTLNASDLNQLFRHEITALQIKSFYPTSHSKMLGKELSDIAKTGQVDNWRVGTDSGRLEVSDVYTMGEYIPYNIAVATGQTEEYFEGVQRDFRKRRILPGIDGQQDERPRLWPLDQLRLELDECWPHGAGLARDKVNRVQGGGLPRIMMGPTRWKRGFIHADQYAPLSSREGLFTGNIYLQLPTDSKGEDNGDKKEGNSQLHIWNLEMKNQIDWVRHQNILQGMTVQDIEMQMQLRKALGEPLKIRVDPGDLVLFCVQKPHCAVGFMDGIRVSLQCFLQYRQAERLLIDI